MAPSTHQWLPDSYLISNSLLSPRFLYFIVSSPTPLGRLESIQTYHDKNITLGLCDLLKTSSFPTLHSPRKNFRITCLSSRSQASIFTMAKSLHDLTTPYLTVSSPITLCLVHADWVLRPCSHPCICLSYSHCPAPALELSMPLSCINFLHSMYH